MKEFIIKIENKHILYAILWICLLQGIISDYIGFKQINYLCDVLLLFLLFIKICKLKITINRNKLEYLPIGLFAIVIILGWIFNPTSIPQAIWGFRNYSRFFLFFIFACNTLDSNDAKKIENIFINIFPFHILLVAFQYITEGLKQDELSGLFGKAVGGNGGLMIYLTITLCIIICRFEYKKISLTKFIAYLLLIFINAALSELKFLFIITIFMVIWYLIMSNHKGRGLILAVLFIISLSIGIQVLYYIFPEWKDYLSFDNIMNAASDQEVYATQTDIGRLSVFSKLTPIISYWGGKDSLLWGIGLGNADYSSAFSALNSSFYIAYEATHYTWLSLGFLFVETGYLGIISYISFFVILEIKAIISYKNNKTYSNLIGTFIPLVLLFIIVYNSSLRSNFAYMAFIMLAYQIISLKKSEKNNNI